MEAHSVTSPRQTASGRSKIYYWLARLFLAKPTYEELTSALDVKLLSILDEALEGNEENIASLKAFAKDLDQNSARKLSQEYSELFIAPVAGKYVPPYESCFLEKISESIYGEIMGKTSLLVKQFYKENGFESTAENTPPDHVGIELLFMSKICEQEANADEKKKDICNRLHKEELRFLREHLCVWLPQFVRKIAAIENGNFYSHLAGLAEGFVRHDMNYLSSTVSGSVEQVPSA